MKIITEMGDIRKLIKQLIKKYHPDLSNDSNMESINSEITKKLTNILNDLKIYARSKQEVSLDVSNQPVNGLIQLYHSQCILSPEYGACRNRE
jgi:hypothetical protein